MLRERLKEALKDAMREQQARKRGTIRLILAAVKDRDIAARVEDRDDRDDDAIITDILSKMIKQRRESIKAYEEGGRCELAEQEGEEISIIEDFLPRQLSDDEVAAAVSSAVEEAGAGSLKDMGRVMGALKAKYSGRMDFGRASALVKQKLT
ncbi:MAG: GatB/YqeY domain-containing protein [Sphingomonadales bacterium]